MIFQQLQTKYSIQILFACLAGTASVQTVSGQVENFDWNYFPESENIEITYDLNQQDNENYFNISLTVQYEGEKITPQYLSGDHGSYISYGSDKKIIWDVYKDISYTGGPLTIDIVATPSGGRLAQSKANPPEPKIKEKAVVPPWAGLTGIFSVGTGLIIKGALDYTTAESDWDSITENKTSSHPQYDDLNKQYKRGQYFIIGGSTIIVGGIVILLKRHISNKKSGTQDVSDISTELFHNISIVPPSNGHQGIGIRYQF